MNSCANRGRVTGVILYAAAFLACVMAGTAASQPLDNHPQIEGKGPPGHGNKFDWPSAPKVDGTGEQEAYFVRSITIEGLDKATLTAKDIADVDVVIDAGPSSWGRPAPGKAKIERLMRPISPLCLYRDEVDRMAKAVVEVVNKRGFIGVFVSIGDPGSAAAHPADGNCVWHLYLASVKEVRVVDHRTAGGPAADLEKIRTECPLKAGGRLEKPKLDQFAERLGSKFGEVNVSIEPTDEPEEVVLTIILGPANPK